MEEFHLRLSQVKNLDSRDAAIARLISRNGWVDPEAVLEAAKAAAEAPDGPRLLVRLTEAGKIPQERARQIQDALERKLAEKAKGTPTPLPVAPPEPEPEEATAPEIIPPPSNEQVTAAREFFQTQDDTKRVESVQFFNDHLRSKLQEDMIDLLVSSGGGPADVDDLSVKTGRPRDAVEKVLTGWRDMGFLKSDNDSPFLYAPNPRQKKAVARHLEWWRDVGERQRCIDTCREPAYAGFLADTCKLLDQSERALRSERSSRKAVESNLEASTKEIMTGAAKLEAALAAVDKLRGEVKDAKESTRKLHSEIKELEGKLKASENMVSLKDQLIAQLMGEKKAHKQLEREHGQLLQKFRELIEERNNDAADSRRAAKAAEPTPEKKRATEEAERIGPTRSTIKIGRVSSRGVISKAS